MRAGLTFLLIALLAQAGHAQQADDKPLYTDDQGEEVFGPDYLPASPADAGETLLVGAPNAGAAVAADLQALEQGDFRKALETGAVPAGADAPTRLPLLRSVREANDIARFAPGAAAAGGAEPAANDDAEMKIHFVYVGQGSGAILEFPCGVAVVDTGGEYRSDDNGGKMFVDYLDSFFKARPALQRTIDVLYTSHPHKDHLYGLQLMKFAGADGFKIRNIVDNGQTGTINSLKTQTDRRAAARAAGAKYSAVEFRRQSFATGVTNAVIDPVKCPTIDPKLTAFWGGKNEAVAGGPSYSNPNNHSMLLRLDFGKASLLFLGDLEREGEADMLREYDDNLGVFDVDVFLASHHGADNGTSDELLRAMSPKIAVISMGDKSSTKPTTAFDHGHPRRTTIARMQEEPFIVSGTREPVTFWGADEQDKPFKTVRINRAIYGTGWEGSLVLTVGADGSYRFEP